MSIRPADEFTSTLAELDRMLELLETSGRDVTDLRAQRLALNTMIDQYKAAIAEQAEAERQRAETVTKMWQQVEALHGTHQEIAMTADEIAAARGAGGEPFARSLRDFADAIKQFAQSSARTIEAS